MDDARDDRGDTNVGYSGKLESYLVQLVRLALSARSQDVQLFVRRIARDLRQHSPSVASELNGYLGSSVSHVLRRTGSQATALPVDTESRLQLAKYEEPPPTNISPILRSDISAKIQRITSERLREAELYRADLHPTRTALFTGPPGVGKTLATRWIAATLRRPLVTLDLSAVMSSFLGRTGNNLRQVLDYAKTTNCVLLLDEFDAIAKRRDDTSELGELKRLVTVLLQEIDDWPPSGLLIAATNHAALLDPAIWRRFEAVVEFPLPDDNLIELAARRFLGTDADAVPTSALVALFRGSSFSEIERSIADVRRESVMARQPVSAVWTGLLLSRAKHMLRRDRHKLAEDLVSLGLSQREVHRITGVSRDTLRRRKSE